MPKTLRSASAKAPAKTPAPSPPPAPIPEPVPQEQETPKPIDTRPVVYDKLRIAEYSSATEIGPLTVEDAKTMMGWEDEKQYQARMIREVILAKEITSQGNYGDVAISMIVEKAERQKGQYVFTSHESAAQALKVVMSNPNIEPKAEHWLFGDNFHCLNTDKVKVRCWYNANNRPFDMNWCEDLIHTILRGNWAGPLMMPGETINCETIRISKYARVLSGQHQLTALPLADEWLQKSRSKQHDKNAPLVARLESLGNVPYPAWDGHEHPVIETIVCTGVSEDERVLRTIDYVKPRTEADMLYTMDLFRQNTPVERKEMTRMLSAARAMLWHRTDTQGYETLPEIVGFLERHKRLLKCVEHLFIENSPKGVDSARKISRLRLSAGGAAALMYLMGCSGPKTDGDAYRWSTPPSEKGLDWSLWDKAKQFWSRLATDRSFIPVRTALANLVDSSADNDENQGLGGRLPEKLAIIAKAWEAYRDAPDIASGFTEEDIAAGGILTLSYGDLDDKGNKLPDGQIKLLDVADFYGIDCPEVVSKSKGSSRGGVPMPPAPTKEEIEKGKQEALLRRQKNH